MFDDVLADYAGATLERMESGGSCHATSTAMFDTHERVTRAAVNALATSTGKYRLFLESADGAYFKNMGDADELRALAIYASADLPDPGVIEVLAPLDTSTPDTSTSEDSGPSGSTSKPEPPDRARISVELGTGLDCLPSDVSGEDLSVLNKLAVLNCLVFSTPHDFWVRQAGMATTSPDSIGYTRGRYANWLTSPDWECTDPAFLEGPWAACYKHDLAFNGLQRFGGKADKYLWDEELDESWNPKNKALADLKFRADILKYGCRGAGWKDKLECALLGKINIAWLYHYSVAKVNHKGWPVIDGDLRGFSRYAQSLQVEIPDLSGEVFERCTLPVFPDMRGGTYGKEGNTFILASPFDAGCVAGADDVRLTTYWTTDRDGIVAETAGRNPCTIAGGVARCDLDLTNRREGTKVVSVFVTIRPLHREYGGRVYRVKKFVFK